MKQTRKFSPIAIATLFGIVAISACSSQNSKQETANQEWPDSIPNSIIYIVKSVADNDSAEFAKWIAYPLLRPYPLKDIGSEDEMKAYYHILMDDSLHNVIAQSKPSDWEKFGWRGYSIGDGNYIWVDSLAYAVNYVSGREQQMIDSLTLVETNSLPAAIRKGWTPKLTMVAKETGKIYRIDEMAPAKDGDDTIYRLCVYTDTQKGKDLLGMPELMLNGEMDIEGSANITSYVFTDKNGGELTIYPEDIYQGSATLDLPDGKDVKLEKAYWYELINR